MEDFGQAKNVTIDKDTTTIVDGAGSSASIEGRVKQLRAQVEDTASEYDREKLQERLAKLVGDVAIIKVGAATETEMKEKRAGGGDRSGQGGPLRTATRGVDRVVAAHDRSGHHADSGEEEGRRDAGRRHGRRHVLRSSGVTHGEPLFNSHGGKPRPRRAGTLTGGRPIGS